MRARVTHSVDDVDALPIGTIIGGYLVRRVISDGYLSIIYEAHNRITGRTVAIKEFHPQIAIYHGNNARVNRSDEKRQVFAWGLRKFEDTAAALSGLSHPNIVAVHDYVPMNDTGYMIMELLDGQTLNDRLRTRAASPRLDEPRPLVDPVMAALSYVHGRGLAHGSVAPDNILITREGRPVLIDFGSVSRDWRRHLFSLGTDCERPEVRYSNYVAPEQILAERRPTVEADVYAMGAVLYQALAGAGPANGERRIYTFPDDGSDPYVPLIRFPGH